MRTARAKGAGGAAILATATAMLFPAGAQAFGVVSTFGSYGPSAGQLSEPLGVAFGPTGLAFVADYGNSRVSVFSPDGSLARAFGKDVSPAGGNVCTVVTSCKAGVADASAGAVNRPEDIEVDAAGNVYVAGTGNNRIDVFSSDGAFLRAFGKAVNPAGGNVCTTATGCQKGVDDGSAGALDSPTGLGIGPDGKLYVAGGNFRIDVLEPGGAFVRAFGLDVNPDGSDVCTASTACRKGSQEDDAGAVNYPYDVAVDAAGRVATTDSNHFRIDVFDPKGAFVRAFGAGVSQGSRQKVSVCTAATGCRRGSESGAAGGWAFPSSIVVAPGGHLYAADVRNHRINEFTFEGEFVRAFGEGVLNGASTFQICTVAAGCRTGISSTNAGSVSYPYGIGVDCRGAVYATELKPPAHARIERFAEPGLALPPCSAAEPETPVPAGGEPSPPAPPFVPPETLPAPVAPVAKPNLKLELNKWNGTATLVVIVSRPGTLLLKGKEVRRVKKQAKNAGLFELLVEATGKAARRLRESGKATVKVTLAFKPEGGRSIAQSRSVTLEMGPRL